MRDIYVLYTLRRVFLFLILAVGLIAVMVWVLNIGMGIVVDKDEFMAGGVEHIKYEMGKIYQWKKEGNRESVAVYQILPSGPSKVIIKEGGQIVEIFYIGEFILYLQGDSVFRISHSYDLNAPVDTVYYPAYIFLQEFTEAEREFEIIKNKFKK